MEKEINEKDGNLEAIEYKAPTRTNITSCILIDDWNVAKQYGISWSDALTFGIRFLAAEQDDGAYPECKLQTKLEKTVKQRNAYMQEASALRDLQEAEGEAEEEVTAATTEEDLKNVFGGLIE